MNEQAVEYVGFWPRFGASIIDTILTLIVCLPLVHLVYGSEYWLSPDFVQGPADFLITWVGPAAVVILFWTYRQATPGKMVIHAKIVDAKTGGKPSTGQLIGRYLAYYVSTIPLLLGFIWVAFDARKQGWHDKLAGTLVIRAKAGG